MSLPTVPVCRICLTNDELQVSLYSEYAQRKLLLTKIRVCLPIKITHADTLPVTICSQCIVRLEQFYEYYCKSETSQRILTEGTGFLTASRKSLPVSYPLNATGSAKGEAAGNAARTCAASEQRMDHGSLITDPMDPILTQSPKAPAVPNDASIQSNASASPGATLSFLLHGSLERSHRKTKKSSTLKDFTTF